MKKHDGNLTDAATLRQMAEERLKILQSQASIPSSESDILKLIHELKVHQIELEMQNEELVIAKDNAEISKVKYTELYDYAPIGYLTLTKEGAISELNFLAAKMLGKNRSQLLKSQFAFFVSVNSRSEFNHFFQEVFSKKEKQTCEAVLATKGNLPIYVNINGIISPNEELCFLTMIDITEQIISNLALQKSEEKYHITQNDLQKAQAISHLGNWKWDIKTNEVVWSDEMFKIFGIDKNSYSGNLGDAILGVIHPDDLHIVLPSIVHEIVKNQQIEFRIIMADKSIRYIWLEAGESIYDNDGKLIFLTGIAQDITGRKLTETKLIKKSKALQQTLTYYNNRELRMVELKREVNELLEKNGQVNKYLW